MNRPLFYSRNKLYVPCAQFFGNKPINFQRRFCGDVVYDCQHIYVDAVFLQQRHRLNHFVEYGFTAACFAIAIVKPCRTVNREPHQELVTCQKFCPLLVNQDTVGLQTEMFDNANNDLRGEIPRLDERFGKFEAGVRENMAQADQIGAEQKGNAQTYTGSAQRTAMENKRQTDAQREKQYAALGTIDSYGTGSFTQGNANADTEFNRNTQQRYDALAQNLTDIDRTVANAKRESLSLIDQERTKYEDTVRQINIQLRDNEVARKGAITEAYYATQERINAISDISTIKVD